MPCNEDGVRDATLVADGIAEGDCEDDAAPSSAGTKLASVDERGSEDIVTCWTGAKLASIDDRGSEDIDV